MTTLLDDAAFAASTEPYRRELHVHSYRMLGSFEEAEDAVQETLLRAWRSRESFDGSAFRAWLYRIATNVCLDQIRRNNRRPRSRSLDSLGEVPWLQPYPDAELGPPSPEARYEQRESVELAFAAALQHLPARQRAVLLETSPDAVNSVLRRARAALGAVDRDSAAREPAPGDRDVLEAYLDAFARHDVDALVALLRDDAILEMPPFELWMRGPDDIRRWLVMVDAFSQEQFVPVAANGSPAVAVYRPASPGGRPRAFTIQVLDIVDGRISAIHVFLDQSLFALFGLPLDPPS